MPGIVILRAALEALNSAEKPRSDRHARGPQEQAPAQGADDPVSRADLIARRAMQRGIAAEAQSLQPVIERQDFYFRDDLDGETVLKLAREAGSQLSLQALPISNARRLDVASLADDINLM